MKKNIHLIPTVNPSRLYSFANKLYLDTIPKRYYKKYNICITDDSDIKEGYYLDLTHNIIMKSAFYPSSDKNGKKIILTTDPILIQSGVQAIPDDFLEFLVQNPSCDSVKINAYPINTNGNIIGTDKHYPFDGLISNFIIKYKIILPKEEPKLILCGYPDKHYNCKECGEPCGLNGHFIEKEEEPKQDYSGVHFRHCYQGEYEDGCKYGKDDCPAKPKEEAKQEFTMKESIEEAAREFDKSKCKHFRREHTKEEVYDSFEEGFIAGAKYQAERMYSEEEVIQILINYQHYLTTNDDRTADEWFENIKKK